MVLDKLDHVSPGCSGWEKSLEEVLTSFLLRHLLCGLFRISLDLGVWHLDDTLKEHGLGVYRVLFLTLLDINASLRVLADDGVDSLERRELTHNVFLRCHQLRIIDVAVFVCFDRFQLHLAEEFSLILDCCLIKLLMLVDDIGILVKIEFLDHQLFVVFISSQRLLNLLA